MHRTQKVIGIQAHEVQTLSCAYTPEALLNSNGEGSFKLHFLDESVTVDATTTIADFEKIVEGSFSSITKISTVGSTHSTICYFNPRAPHVAHTKISFIADWGTMPEFQVSEANNTSSIVSSQINGLDSVKYIKSGLYSIAYTATVSGSYDISVSLNGSFVLSDLSAGVLVTPSKASAPHSTHNFSYTVVAGVQHSFAIQAIDRFGSTLVGSLAPWNEFIATLSGKPHACNSRSLLRATVTYNSLVETTEYLARYTPEVAGLYEARILLRSQGGLVTLRTMTFQMACAIIWMI